MRFDFTRSLAGGMAADPDPRSAPASVTDAMMFQVPGHLRGTDAWARRLLVALEGTAANTVGLELWALDEPDGQDPAGAGAVARKFYQLTTATQTYTVAQLREYSTNMPAPGKVYARVVTAPAADAVLKIANA